MVRNFFKNDDEKTRGELFNKKWKEYIERIENRDPDTQTNGGDTDAG